MGMINGIYRCVHAVRGWGVDRLISLRREAMAKILLGVRKGELRNSS